MQQQLEQGFLNKIEGRQITKDGREIVFDVNTKLITYKGQAAVLAVDRDVTERKLAEQQLRESEARYRAIVEDQTEMICRFTPDFVADLRQRCLLPLLRQTARGTDRQRLSCRRSIDEDHARR